MEDQFLMVILEEYSNGQTASPLKGENIFSNVMHIINNHY